VTICNELPPRCESTSELSVRHWIWASDRGEYCLLGCDAWYVSTNFGKSPQCQISWESTPRFSNWYRTEGQTDTPKTDANWRFFFSAACPCTLNMKLTAESLAWHYSHEFGYDQQLSPPACKQQVRQVVPFISQSVCARILLLGRAPSCLQSTFCYALLLGFMGMIWEWWTYDRRSFPFSKVTTRQL
jgi:hypothetical protein